MRFAVQLTDNLTFHFSADTLLHFVQMLLLQVELDRLTWQQYELYKICYEHGVDKLIQRSVTVFERNP